MKEELKGAARTNKQTWIQAKFRICLFNICQTWTKVYLSLKFFFIHTNYRNRWILLLYRNDCLKHTLMQIKTCFQYQPSDTIQTRTEWTKNKKINKIKKTALLCCWFNYSIRLEDQIENTARKRILFHFINR